MKNSCFFMLSLKVLLVFGWGGWRGKTVYAKFQSWEAVLGHKESKKDECLRSSKWVRLYYKWLEYRVLDQI